MFSTLCAHPLGRNDLPAGFDVPAVHLNAPIEPVDRNGKSRVASGAAIIG
ncbi:hypothetical protein [Burkholderia pyrrocinia]|nr:hypothetical protein [Burkholderia pyrrocinia]